MPDRTLSLTATSCGFEETARTPKRRKKTARLVYPLTFASPLAAWQIAFFVVPLGFLLMLSFWVVQLYRLTPAMESANWESVYGSAYFWQTYLRTVAMSSASALLLSLIAFPCSCYLAFRASENLRRLAILMLITPFFTSYLVRVYTWQAFLSDQGIINAALTLAGLPPVALLNGPVGTFIGYATLCLPLVILLQLMSLSNIDRTLIEAARNLRCGPMRTIYEVVVPAGRVGLVLGATFAFILTMGDFVSPTYLGGGNPPTLSIQIIDFTKSGNQWPRAAVVALTMIATLMVTAFIAVRFAYSGRARQ